MIFDGTQDAGEATVPGIKEGPAATVFSDEVCRSVLGGKPRHHEEISVFSERPELTSTPPLPDTAQAAAHANGSERYEGFVAALGRRIARGQSLAEEITMEMNASDTAL